MKKSDERRLLKEYMVNRKGAEMPGESIREHIESAVGGSTVKTAIALSGKNEIFARICPIGSDGVCKVLYTTGLFMFQMVEFVLCLPASWPVEGYGSEDFLPDPFPVDVLRALGRMLERKGAKPFAGDGFVIDRNKSPWNRMAWPEGMAGLVAMDLAWGGDGEGRDEGEDGGEDGRDRDDDDDAVVTLYSLVPVFETGIASLKKKDVADWMKDRRVFSWAAVAFPENPAIDARIMMNEAIGAGSLEKVKAAVAAGADVNGNYYFFHDSFGMCTEETYLERTFFDEESEPVLRYLVEQGARVPPDAVAQVAGWGTKEIFSFLIAHGSDIDALDRVGWNALKRAGAFENREGRRDLLALGAAERDDAD